MFLQSESSSSRPAVRFPLWKLISRIPLKHFGNKLLGTKRTIQTGSSWGQFTIKDGTAYFLLLLDLFIKSGLFWWESLCVGDIGYRDVGLSNIILLYAHQTVKKVFIFPDTDPVTQDNPPDPKLCVNNNLDWYIYQWTNALHKVRKIYIFEFWGELALQEAALASTNVASAILSIVDVMTWIQF